MIRKSHGKRQSREPLYRILYWVFFAALVLFTSLSTFGVIGETPIFDWDEARHGISAYEMLESGDWIAHTYLGETDYWNLKPPLSFWSIAAAYKLFGLSAFSLRFFSALALVVIVTVATLFFRRHFRPYLSLIAGLLFSLIGVQMNHLFLHGDADALFYLFFFLAVIFFCEAYLSSEKFLIGSGLSIAMAFLAKASHVAVPGLILVISAILLWKVKQIKPTRWLLYWILPMAAPVLVWGLVRYARDGFAFLGQMLFVDILARASTGLEGNVRGGGYYVRELIRVLGPMLFALCILAVLFALVSLFLKKLPLEPRDRVLPVVGITTSIVPIVFYSLMTTKLSWYVWPSTIGFVLLLAWSVQFIWQRRVDLGKKRKDQVLWPGVMTFCCVLLTIGLGTMSDHKLMLYYYDTSTLRPAQSVFYDLPKGDGERYCVVDETGGQADFSQSWILHGIYSGYDYRPGDLAAFAADESRTYLFVKRGGAEAGAFAADHPELQKVCEADGYTVYSKA